MKNFPIRDAQIDVWQCWICHEKGIGKVLPETHECELTLVNRNIGYYLETTEGKFFSFLAKRLIHGSDGSNHTLA